MRYFPHFATLGLLLLLSCTPTFAVDMAIPMDMYEWTLESTSTTPGEYYLFDLLSKNYQTGEYRGYIVTLDHTGDMVWFRKAGVGHVQVGTWLPHPEVGWFTYTHGGTDRPNAIVVLDETLTVIDSIITTPHDNDRGLFLDGHEILFRPDGSVWTSWRMSVDEDLSDDLPGGASDITIDTHVFQQWDGLDGDLIWEWVGTDHLDELPYTARLDSTRLLEPSVYAEHLHVNSIGFFPDGDLLVSSRDMSIIFRIDYPSGDVLWRMGGGPANDFTFIDGIGSEVPASFNHQHDARVWPDGYLTLYDNGPAHPLHRSYAKGYTFDENAMIATLLWEKHIWDVISVITGSVRRDGEDNILIGWGGYNPPLSGSEYAPDGSLRWAIQFQDDDWLGENIRTYGYRVLKDEGFPASAKPDVFDVIHQDQVILYANWFGHLDDVAEYAIYFGDSPNPEYHGTTATGEYAISTEIDEPYYARAQALDTEGNPISPMSDVRVINWHLVGVDEPSETQPILPSTITLAPAWPNPFNGETRITVSLDRPGMVDVSLHNLLGQQVAAVWHGPLGPGNHALVVDAHSLASGTYLVRARSPFGSAQQRVSLVR